MKKHAIFVGLVLAGLTAGGNSLACICPRTPSIQEFEARSDQLHLDTWIFLGTVTSSRQKTPTSIVRLKMLVGELRELFGGDPYWAPDDLRKVIQFEVLESFRGTATGADLEASSGNCGPFFEVERQYLVVATRKTANDPWLAEGCTPTAPVEAAAESIAILRARKVHGATGSDAHHIDRAVAMPNKPPVPTRNGEAPLLAAQRRR